MAETLDWLCPPTVNPNLDLENNRTKVTENTAIWIFDHPRYKRWESNSISLLSVNGKSSALGLSVPILMNSGCWKDYVNVLHLDIFANTPSEALLPGD